MLTQNELMGYFLNESNEVLEDDDILAEGAIGMTWAELKNNFLTNNFFLYRKALKSLGIKEFPTQERKDKFKELYTKTLEERLAAATSKENLESFIAKQERFIKAAGGLKRIANISGDATDVKNYNQAIIAITTQLNQQYLEKAQSKLKKVK